MAKKDAEEPVVFVPEQPEKETRGRKAGMTAMQIAMRNLEVVSDRMRGDSVEVVANKYGLSGQRIRGIMAEYRESNPTLRHHDPVDIVDELLDGYTADLRALNDTYDQAAKGNNLNARIGAVNARMTARARIAELLQAIGVLPHDLGTMHLVIDGQIAAEKVIAVLERYDVPEEIFTEIERAFDAEATAVELPAGP